MKNILCSESADLRLPKESQARRIRAVMNHELTELQRQTVMAYYFYHFTIPEIARMRSVNKSTVCRTLKRAERRLKSYLQY